MEQWIKIKGFDGYEVSNEGNVRKGNRILKKTLTPSGAKVTLRAGDKPRYRIVNRLVADAFKPGWKGVLVNIDGDPRNNAVSNLDTRPNAKHIYAGATCKEEECNRKPTARGLCGKHYQSWYFDNAQDVRHRDMYEVVGYRAAHARLRLRKGIASEFKCACGAQADDWALLTMTAGTLYKQINMGDINRVYSLDMDDYTPMCKPCHYAYDKKARGNLIQRFNDCIAVSVRERETRSEIDYVAATEDIKATGAIKPLAGKYGISPGTLAQIFKITEGKTFREWQAEQKGAA